MRERDAVLATLREAGVWSNHDQLVDKVLGIEQGHERLMVSVLAAKSDPTVKHVAGVIAKQIDTNRLADLGNAKLMAHIRRRQTADLLSDDDRQAMYPALRLARWNEQNAISRDPVGTRYFRVSDAYKGVTDPPAWAVKTEEGLDVLIGPRNKEEEEEEGFFIKGTDRWYTRRFPKSVRESELRRQAELIRSQA